MLSIWRWYSRSEVVMLRRFSLLPMVIAGLMVMVFSLPVQVGASADVASAGKDPVSETPADSGGLGGRFMVEVSQRMARIADQLSEVGQGLLAAPDKIQDLAARAQDPQNLMRWGEMAGKVVLVLGAGFLVGWLVRRVLSRMRRAVDDRKTDRPAMRVVFLIKRTVIDVIPILAFGIAAYGVLPLTHPRFETRLVALTLINANVLVRFILALSNMVLAPRTPSLRLLPVGEETVVYLHIWIRRMVGLGLYGYFMLEAALVTGMPGGLYSFLMKFLALAITLMLVTLVMQNKNEVARWLRQDRPGPVEAAKTDPKPLRFPAIGTFRHRLADVWHMVAITLVVIIFVTWLLEIEGVMAFFFIGVAWTAAVVLLTGFLLRLVHRGVGWLFQISAELKTAFPGLEDRANRYQPFVRGALKAVVYVVAVFSIFEAWGLGTFSWLFSPLGGHIVGELMILVLIIAAAFVLWEIVSMVIERALVCETQKEIYNTRTLTLLPLFRNVVRITLAVIATMLVLSQIGINIGPLLAGAGVVGLAIGFGAQALVRDVITGAFILFEDAISVGDWVTAGGHSGTVERLSVRTLTLRDLAGTVHLIPFGEVTTVTNHNRDFGYALIDIGVAYRERYEDVVQALRDVAIELRQDETWGPNITGELEVLGMNNLADSAVEIRVRLRTRPMRQFAVRRAFLEKMKRVFDERDIEIPFPHRTIWFGTDKNGMAPPVYYAKNDPKAPPLEKPAAGPAIQLSSASEFGEGAVEGKESAGRQDAPDERV